MNVHQQLSRVIAVVCMLVSCAMFCYQARAQPAAPFSALEKAITTSFPLLNTQAYTGNDWCLEVETDPNENWWYFKYNGQLVPHQSLYAARIRLIYKGSSGVEGFASLFLGMDLMEPGGYINYSDYSRYVQTLNWSTAVLSTITFPSNSQCGTLADFLKVVFSNNLKSWTPLGDPLCDDLAGKCSGVTTATGQRVVERQTSALKPCDPDPSSGANACGTDIVDWNFNGRRHKIAGAIRFFVRLPDDPSGKAAYGYLTVGFGGNSGAG